MATTDFQRRLEDSHQFFGRTPSRLRRFHIDFFLIVLLLAMTGIGLTILYSASGSDMASVKRQGVYFIVAWIAMIGVAQIPPETFRNLSPVLYGLGFICCICADFRPYYCCGSDR